MKRFIVVMSATLLILASLNLSRGGEGRRGDSMETVRTVSEGKNYEGLHNP